MTQQARTTPPGRTAPPGRPLSSVSRSVWRRMGLWGLAHAVDDLYQGLVPACVPYFVLDRGYSYVAASGLTLAAALGSSVPQPFVGMAVDRRPMPRLAGAGVLVAGLGAGLSGLVDSYAAVWTLILLSGIGVALFHPPAGKAAREAAGESAAAMSVFAAGGSVGFFLAPVLATPALVALGVGATALFIPPALIVGLALMRRRDAGPRSGAKARTGRDRWGPFLVLTGVAVVRSAAFFGVLTFVELYWFRHLHAGHGLAGAALACFLMGGVAGTLLGGRIADRIGAVRTVRLGAGLSVPLLVALRLAPGALVPLLIVLLAGVALNIPFAVVVKLGQDYLPGRPGTAAGVTLGLAVSVGGLFAPLLGAVAQRSGPEGVFSVLWALPGVALGVGLFLREPGEGDSGEAGGGDAGGG